MSAAGTSPEFSIIISLVDHRDMAEESVLSFAGGQDFDPEGFELIVVSDGAEPSTDEQIKGLLREHDQFVIEPSRNEYRLFNRGAKVASGDVLIIVESHCVAVPDFLAQFQIAFRNTELNAARGTSIGVANSVLEEYERSVFEDSFAIGLNETDWNRVLIHCFAIRRQVYEEVGGFGECWENFGPWVLGAELHRLGITIEWVENAKVRHYYMGARDELRGFITRFTRAEWKYRAEGDQDLRDRYFPEVPKWEAEPYDKRRVTKSFLLERSGLLAIRQAFSIQRRNLFLQVIKLARKRLFPQIQKQERKLIRETDSSWRKAERSSSREDFFEFWEACGRLGRFQALCENEKAVSQRLNLNETVSVDQFSASSLYGWYEAETGNSGSKFNWSEPLCGIRVRPPRGVRRVLIEMETDTPGATECRLIFGDRISWAQIRSLNPMVLEFQFHDYLVAEGWLTFVSPGFREPNADRLLGMSVRTVTLSG